MDFKLNPASPARVLRREENSGSKKMGDEDQVFTGCGSGGAQKFLSTQWLVMYIWSLGDDNLQSMDIQKSSSGGCLHLITITPGKINDHLMTSDMMQL